MSDNLNNKLEYIKKKGYIQYISPEAIPFLTEKKIDNFILACEEEEKGILEVKSLPYHIVLEPTNACNLRCPLCPTGLELSDRKKGIAKLDEIGFVWGKPTMHSNKDIWDIKYQALIEYKASHNGNDPPVSYKDEIVMVDNKYKSFVNQEKIQVKDLTGKIWFVETKYLKKI